MCLGQYRLVPILSYCFLYNRVLYVSINIILDVYFRDEKITISNHFPFVSRLLASL